MIPAIVIAGPTCTGKSAVAVRLAELVDGEVVSADSMQVYRGMDIGTAKLSADEMRGVRHHMIDVADPAEPFTVERYRSMVAPIIDDIRSRGKTPIIAGGTGFYIESLLFDPPDAPPGVDRACRDRLRREVDSGNLGKLYSELEERDPEYASTVHPNNSHRISRALEYIHATGGRYSEYVSMGRRVAMDFRCFVLEDDRATLYGRIDRRVDDMIDRGFAEEVGCLMASGVPRDAVSMQGVGYRQMFDYVSGSMSLDEAKSSMKAETHHAAKRQSTWFRNRDYAEVVHVGGSGRDPDRIASHIARECMGHGYQ